MGGLITELDKRLGHLFSEFVDGSCYSVHNKVIIGQKGIMGFGLPFYAKSCFSLLFT